MLFGTASATTAGNLPAMSGVLVPQVSAQWPGRIFVNHDEWPLSDYAFGVAPDTHQFAVNLASWLTGGKPGRFLAWGGRYEGDGERLAATMRGAGHSWTVSTSLDFSLPTLLQYDAIFLANIPADNYVLIDYVHAGGSVYLAGGSGMKPSEAAIWNTFLNTFNLGFQPQYNLLSGIIPILSASPVFAGVSALYQANGTSILVFDPTDRAARILYTYRDESLFATYSTDAIAVPIDIMPENCPNVVNPRSRATLRAAVLGSRDFDVQAVDPSSVRLLGIPPSRALVADIGAPTGPPLGNTTIVCGPPERDRSLDLVLEFDLKAVIHAVETALNRSLREGDVVALTVTGTLRPEFDQRPFVGEDVVVIKHDGVARVERGRMDEQPLSEDVLMPAPLGAAEPAGIIAERALEDSPHGCSSRRPRAPRTCRRLP